MTLRDEIEQAEARLSQLRRLELAATCAEVGHRWKHIGGKNAGCGPDCGCSVPVYECEVCRDCDYGDNAEAVETRAECARLYPPEIENDDAPELLIEGGEHA